MEKIELTQRERMLLEALKEYIAIWNSGDATSGSKRAQGRRIRMWEKIDAALEACGEKREK